MALNFAAGVNGGKIYTLYTGPQLTVAATAHSLAICLHLDPSSQLSVVTDSLFATGTTVLQGLTKVNPKVPTVVPS